MNVKFADSFTESLRRLARNNRWYMRAWRSLTYDVPTFFKNVWRFRKELWHHRWYNWESHMAMLRRSLEIAVDPIELIGNEIDESRLKKVSQMRRAIELIKNFEEDNFISMAESELGEIIHKDWEFEEVPDSPGYIRLKDTDTEEERLHNRRVFDRSYEIEEAQWTELWKIIVGQDRQQIRKMIQLAEKSGEDIHKTATGHFDGTDLRRWWD